uniref:UDENN domain-containing protein n=1 Tax=Periophthalmus magnuspinnatus TaxID=409849 RepID=A0A3B3Z9V2_9GOBI
CQTLPRFCFPYDIQRARDGVAVQHFTFALTDLEGCQRFGFCRLANTSQTCLCILRYRFIHTVNKCMKMTQKKQLDLGHTGFCLKMFVCMFYQKMVPYFIAPDPRSLPSIPESRNLTELIVAVDVGNLLQLYANMLFERRILIFASKLSTLTSCVHALSAVLYPMYWQHIFIPVLPPHLLDYCW